MARPVDDPVDRFHWEGVERGELLVQRCTGCATLRHPPQPMCGTCHALDWEPAALAGTGTVLSWIESRHPSEPDADPRLVAVVAMDEGVRVVSNLAPGRADGARNGLRVRVEFVAVDGVALHRFVPAAP